MSDENQEIKSLITSGQKIEAINFVRKQEGIGLKAAKEMVEALEKKMLLSGEKLPPARSDCFGGMASALIIMVLPIF
jgi:hypothetical protein